MGRNLKHRRENQTKRRFYIPHFDWNSTEKGVNFAFAESRRTTPPFCVQKKGIPFTFFVTEITGLIRIILKHQLYEKKQKSKRFDASRHSQLVYFRAHVQKCVLWKKSSKHFTTHESVYYFTINFLPLNRKPIITTTKNARREILRLAQTCTSGGAWRKHVNG